MWSFNKRSNTCSKSFLKFESFPINFENILTTFRNFIHKKINSNYHQNRTSTSNNTTNNNSSQKMTFDVENLTVSDHFDQYIPDDCPNFLAIVKGIIISRSNCGATIEDIKNDYFELEGQTFPHVNNMTEFLLRIPNLICKTNENGTRLFEITSSERSQHIISLIRNQKPQKISYKKKLKSRNSVSQQNYHHHADDHHNNHDQPLKHAYFYQSSTDNYHQQPTAITSTASIKSANSVNQFAVRDGTGNSYEKNNCYYEDNYHYLKKFQMGGSVETLQSKQTSYMNNNYNSSWNSRYTTTGYGTDSQRLLPPPPTSSSSSSYNNLNESKTTTTAHLYDYDLIGDDFLLSLARIELGCKYQKKNGVMQAGLCISGQNITDALYRLKKRPYLNQKIILNLGSVDILQGHHFIDMQYDYLNIINHLMSRGFRPILTTLAPLANHGHRPDICRKLRRFNEFIRSIGMPYIDLWAAMVSTTGYTLYDCYQSGARYVSGTCLPHVLWNQIGRQRILNMIKSELEPF